MVKNIILISAAMVTIILSGCFSGAETGLYRLSRLRLKLGMETKKLGSIILGKATKDNIGLLLSLLLGNNLTHYLATSIVTYTLFTYIHTGPSPEILATVITAPILFVFGEVIPKNLFFFRADRLMIYMGPLLLIFYRIFRFSGILAILKRVLFLTEKVTTSGSMPKATMSGLQKHYMETVLQDTQNEGILSTTQTDIIKRMVKTSNVTLRSAMIPMTQVEKANVNSDRNDLLEILKGSAFTRYLVTNENKSIIGFVNIYDALNSEEKFCNLQEFLNPIRQLSIDTLITDAINIMQIEHNKIALVTKSGYLGRTRPVGIITMKDLVEELVGELAEW